MAYNKTWGIGQFGPLVQGQREVFARSEHYNRDPVGYKWEAEGGVEVAASLISPELFKKISDEAPKPVSISNIADETYGYYHSRGNGKSMISLGNAVKIITGKTLEELIGDDWVMALSIELENKEKPVAAQAILEAEAMSTGGYPCMSSTDAPDIIFDDENCGIKEHVLPICYNCKDVLYDDPDKKQFCCSECGFYIDYEEDRWLADLDKFEQINEDLEHRALAFKTLGKGGG